MFIWEEQVKNKSKEKEARFQELCLHTSSLPPPCHKLKSVVVASLSKVQSPGSKTLCALHDVRIRNPDREHREHRAGAKMCRPRNKKARVWDPKTYPAVHSFRMYARREGYGNVSTSTDVIHLSRARAGGAKNPAVKSSALDKYKLQRKDQRASMRKACDATPKYLLYFKYKMSERQPPRCCRRAP